MWHSIFAYIKYLFLSKSKYSIHSPFVYDFVTKGLEPSISVEYSQKLNAFRNDLLDDNTVIEVSDFGAGSKVFKSNQRKICKIAKYASISKNKANLLQKIICYFKPIQILELGTSLGIGSAAMRIVAPHAKISSIEGCPQTASKAKEYFQKHQVKNISILTGKFSSLLPKLCQKNTFDLIYFDGNHQKKATLEYFNTALQSIHNDSLFIFDDIHWSTGMEEAWNSIKKHSKVTLSIDLFHIGIVFFRKEQVKQDFVIRI